MAGGGRELGIGIEVTDRREKLGHRDRWIERWAEKRCFLMNRLGDEPVLWSGAPGIYGLRFVPSWMAETQERGMLYVGQASCIVDRVGQHKRLAKRGLEPAYLQSWFDEVRAYPGEVRVELYELVPPGISLSAREQWWFNKLSPMNRRVACRYSLMYPETLELAYWRASGRAAVAQQVAREKARQAAWRAREAKERAELKAYLAARRKEQATAARSSELSPV